MLIQLHTPNGIVKIDSNTITDSELVALRITREVVKELVTRDLAAEVDALGVEMEEMKKEG